MSTENLNTDAERAEFEAAFESMFFSSCFEREADGSYAGRGLQGAWLGWQKARAAQPAPVVPEGELATVVLETILGWAAEDWSWHFEQYPDMAERVRSQLVPTRAGVDAMVGRFLSWPLPADVCADPCASMPDYPHRSGTNLLNAEQAKAMLLHVLAAAPAQGQQVDQSEQSLGMVQHARDSAELRRLCAERDEAKRQVAALRQHKTDYMEAAEVTRKALEAELSALKAQQVGQEPAAIVEHSDYMAPEELTGEKPRRIAVRELHAGALQVGAKLYTTPQPDAGGDITLSNEGAQILAECVGAHAYVLGALVNGRPDLALNEAKKWVDGFMDAGAALAAHDKQSGG